MTGHQRLFALWGLDCNAQQIALATSTTQVRDSLYWLTTQTDQYQFNQVLKFFEAYQEYAKIQPDIAEMVKDPDLKYAYTQLNISSTIGVRYASMWVCSPKAKKIAFLSAY